MNEHEMKALVKLQGFELCLVSIHAMRAKGFIYKEEKDTWFLEDKRGGMWLLSTVDSPMDEVYARAVKYIEHITKLRTRRGWI